MSPESALATKVARLEHELEQARKASARQHAQLHQIDAESTALRKELTPERVLPLAPLIWALLGMLLALGAGMACYITALLAFQRQYPDSDTGVGVIFLVLCAAGAGLTLLGSRRPGAGASARLLMRRLTLLLVIGCGVALAEGFALGCANPQPSVIIVTIALLLLASIWIPLQISRARRAR